MSLTSLHLGTQNSNFEDQFESKFLRNGCLFALDQNRLLIGWGGWQKSDRAPQTGCALYTPDFYLQSVSPWRIPEHFEVVSREFFSTSVLPKLRAEVKPENQRFQWVEPSRESFEQQVRKIRAHFENARLEKAVPVVHAQALEIMTQDRLLTCLEALAKAPASLIPSGFWDENGEGLVGATPERLFGISNGKVSTMALAGTRAKTSQTSVAAEAKALLSDPKERHEHQLVIDDLRERLGAFGRVSIGETKVAELPTLLHLKTEMTVETTGASFADLALALHPTPALGVSPRAFDFQNMKEWDDVGLRGRFGAPFGLSLHRGTDAIEDCLVAIRNVQWLQGRAPTLGSGCGFVRASEIDREWSELQLKRDSVKKVLNV